MDLQLSGRTALVTGSTSGIGAAIAKMLAAEGASVIIHGRDQSRATAVRESIIATGGRARVVIGDLSTPSGVRSVIRDSLEGSSIDILVNNAGSYDYQSWTELTDEDWASSYQTNVITGVAMIRGLVPGMRERRWGRVVQIGAGLAIEPSAAQPHYNAAVAARHNLTVSLARELAGTGVTSNTVSPGPILVDSVQRILESLAVGRSWGSTVDDIEQGAARDLFPNDIGRLGRPDEVAAAVSFLCGPLAGYISGSIISVDGGAIRSVH